MFRDDAQSIFPLLHEASLFGYRSFILHLSPDKPSGIIRGRSYGHTDIHYSFYHGIMFSLHVSALTLSLLHSFNPGSDLILRCTGTEPLAIEPCTASCIIRKVLTASAYSTAACSSLFPHAVRPTASRIAANTDILFFILSPPIPVYLCYS